MAPRHIRRSSQVSHKNYHPLRSRYPEELISEVYGTASSVEVPFYAAAKTPRSVRDMMRMRMGEKSGISGHGLPVGTIGRIAYPLSEEENEMLYSIGRALHVASPVVASPEDGLLLGGWMTGLLMQ